MAFAKLVDKEIEVVHKEKVTIVNLELTSQEAVLIRMIMQRVGGNPDHTRRKDADSIDEALSNAGISLPHNPWYVEEDEEEFHGNIVFHKEVY